MSFFPRFVLRINVEAIENLQPLKIVKKTTVIRVMKKRNLLERTNFLFSPRVCLKFLQ